MFPQIPEYAPPEATPEHIATVKGMIADHGKLTHTLRESLQKNLLTEDGPARFAQEAEQVQQRQTGEHKLFTNALEAFMKTHPHPTAQQKIEFMKRQRALLLKRRGLYDISRHFPDINTAPKNLSDTELLQQFENSAKGFF